jgi:hypothetical protein
LPGSEVDSRKAEQDSSAFGTLVVFFSQLLVVTALWRRLHVPYQQWPWKLASLEDPRLTPDEKHEVCDLFSRAPDCCLDRGLSKPLKGVIQEPSELLDRLSAVTRSISVTKIVNSQIENNFARACSASKCARGLSA